jgi:16S rRNA G966 N2-methylase RsmD
MRLSGPAELDLSTFLNQLKPDLPTSTNQGAADVAFQRWFRVKEAFSPLFVREVISKLPAPPKACLDCFGGSGTTALTCQFMGIAPTTIELNPFLADLIEAKLTSFSSRAVERDRLTISRSLDTISVDLARDYANAPVTLYEPGKGGRWIFDAAVLRRIAQYRGAIANLGDEAHRRLFRVILGSTLIHLSNVVINGKGRRYRGNWQRIRRDARSVDLAFQTAFDNALFDISRLTSRAHPEYKLLRGDARSRLAELDTAFDLVLFSPPYPNSFDYTDIYNIELWVLGYLASGEDNLELRRRTLRSHVQIKRDASLPEHASQTLSDVMERLATVSDRLWSRQIPGMIGSYFADLETIMRLSAERLTPSGRIAMVVGDSRYANVVVPVAKILAEIGAGLGLAVDRLDVLRPMRASAQQGGEHLLSEDLLMLRFA